MATILDCTGLDLVLLTTTPPQESWVGYFSVGLLRAFMHYGVLWSSKRNIITEKLFHRTFWGTRVPQNVSVGVCSLEMTDDLCSLRGMSGGLISAARTDAYPCCVTEVAGSPDAFLKLLPWESVFLHGNKSISSPKHRSGEINLIPWTYHYFNTEWMNSFKLIKTYSLQVTKHFNLHASHSKCMQQQSDMDTGQKCDFISLPQTYCISP